MANPIKQVVIPDLGGASDVEVIEILVKPGDAVSQDDALITLESDKASMDVPAPFAGVVQAVQIKIGDKVNEGAKVLTVTPDAVEQSTVSQAPPNVGEAQLTTAKTPASAQESAEQVVNVPDIGEVDSVDVIEVNVQVGDQVAQDDPLITLESDKASMEVPSPVAGRVTALKINVGDKVTTGDAVLSLQVSPKSSATATDKSSNTQKITVPTLATTPAVTTGVKQSKSVMPSDAITSNHSMHAGPAVRRMARELGVDLTQVSGSAAKGRIVKEDVQQFVKSHLQSAPQGHIVGPVLAPPPRVDFAKFGAVETVPLTKIKKLTGANLRRNWVSIPHVTQFEEADITDMEAFRQSQKKQLAAAGIRLTPLVFIMKAVVAALREFPTFNASLDATGQHLIMKKYFHLGVAVDTPNGLVVPVIRDVAQKGLFELAEELAAISTKAREQGLGLSDMQGGCFSISSLGGIGGTAFTPIINAPEVAILGVSKMQWKPIGNKEGEYRMRLMLPLSLSYDHRVIDGAEAARFIVFLATRLADIRTLLF